VEVRLRDGRRHLLVARDVEDPLGLSPRGVEMVQPRWGVRLSGEMCFVRAEG